MEEKIRKLDPYPEETLADESEHIKMGTLGAEDAEDEQPEDVKNRLKLKHPLKVAGKMLDHIDYDLDGLTAADMHWASKYLKNLGIPVSIQALDYDYQLTLFRRAVKKTMPDVEYADLMRLSAADATVATGLVRDFLLGQDPGLKDLGSEE